MHPASACRFVPWNNFVALAVPVPNLSLAPTQVLQVKVKPSARASSFTQSPEGLWLAQLKSPPVDGKANRELIGLVAKHFGCAKAAVSIRSGASGRMKLVQVEL